MKNKIIFVILILLCISTNVLGFTGITNVEYNGSFNEQIYDNYISRNNTFNDKTPDYWGGFKNQEGAISTTGTLDIYSKYNVVLTPGSSGIIYNAFTLIDKTSGNAQSGDDANINNWIYSPYTLFTNTNATEILYKNGAISIPSIYITSENDGGITIYNPQKNTTDGIVLYIHEYGTNILYKTLIIDEVDFPNNTVDGRFWTFTGEEIETILNITETSTYYIRLYYYKSESDTTGSYMASTPLFTIDEIESTGGGDTGDGDTGGGSIDTGKIEQELGNINSSIQQGNDYITENPTYDEDGNLAGEQTGLIGKILQGFWNLLIKFFDFLMVPDEEQIKDVVNDVLENDLIRESVLGLPLQLISRFLKVFENQNFSDWIISWDDINFTFTEKDGSEVNMKMFNAYSFNISEFVRNDEILSKIYSYYLILINFGAVCGLIYWGAGLVKGLMGIENEMPGANDETESPAVSSTPETSGESDAEALERYLQKNYNDYYSTMSGSVYSSYSSHGPNRPNPHYKVIGKYRSIISDMKAGRYKKK